MNKKDSSAGSSKGRDRVYVDKKDRSVYEELQKATEILGRKENKDAFLLSMTVGYKEQRRKPLKSKFGWARTSYFSEDERTLIKAIAVKEKGSLKVLAYPDEVYSIAEEYAAGGLALLKNMALGSSGADGPPSLETSILDLALGEYEAKVERESGVDPGQD